jgi:hypothetical protein
MVLDNEKSLNIEKLNEALRPYWPILWQVCARGHYLRHGQPLRDSAFWGADFRSGNRAPLPSFQEGEYRLDFHRGPETEFSVWLHFPGRFAPQYPLYDYPRIAEFRTILERLDVREHHHVSDQPRFDHRVQVYGTVKPSTYAYSCAKSIFRTKNDSDFTILPLASRRLPVIASR